ncbi:hypothetical protein [Lysinibacillus pakistanensis]|uniref:Uncharacterized protein n=1 Tax=Lysinibacillus pakistanensis TaxID=759811 RepID=A0AAX3X2B7_9BACI|nr:hypothetical protein [Lysinibacillus pakistanensis]MDM5233583.1 hypothetical protein [Lysinibacillus pakistanensis]QGG51564.1 hypothetical protein GDS87_11665 [Lysinibacillus pakistanensis]WHY49048.1 hypothetical protein QNH22_12745 [Lysinibacillus pakistanensis]WHY54061.1 hypothetical protein QNH24_12725 [Lysinibacillus pakistanensis]
MTNLDLKMESWLALNDISLHQNLEPVAIKLAPSDQTVVSQGIFVGSQLSEARIADNQVQQALQNFGRYSSAVKEAAKVAPTTGLTTILDIARIVSNFNPALPNDKNNVPAYEKYVSKILQNPLIHLLNSSLKSFKRRTSDWNEVIDQIANLYNGISAVDKGKIVESLKALANSASSSSSEKQTEKLFTQSTINCEENIDIYIYSSSVTMEEHNGKHNVKQVEFEIQETQLRFTKELWSLYSDAVLAKHLALMDDWLNGIDTKADNRLSTLTCLV